MVYLKFALISAIISVILFLFAKYIGGTLTWEEKLAVTLGNKFPKRTYIATAMYLISLVVTFVAIIIWIVHL